MTVLEILLPLVAVVLLTLPLIKSIYRKSNSSKC